MRKIYPAVVVFYDGQGRVLMHHRRGKISKFGEKWAFLGGGMEAGETPLEAAKREIKEEIGFQLNDSKDRLVFFKQYQDQFDEDTEAEVNVFEAKFPGFDKLKDTGEVKLSDLKFYTIEEAKKLDRLFPVAWKILNDLEGSLFVPQES